MPRQRATHPKRTTTLPTERVSVNHLNHSNPVVARMALVRSHLAPRARTLPTREDLSRHTLLLLTLREARMIEKQRI